MGENGVVLITGWFETKRVLGWTVAMGSHRSIEGHDSPPPVDIPGICILAHDPSELLPPVEVLKSYNIMWGYQLVGID
jgi:hypothetical protein